jgi:hypothetical protein
VIRRSAIPADALHARYGRDGAYLDCFIADLDRVVPMEAFIEAFYTTWLFKLERRILAWTVDKPSTDTHARELAHGQRKDFAAWTLEARTDDQLLMCDFLGTTRSWLRSSPERGGTRLFFGSVVTARRDVRSGRMALGWSYRLLLGFHKLYSRALLSVARAKLRRQLSLKA